MQFLVTKSHVDNSDGNKTKQIGLRLNRQSFSMLQITRKPPHIHFNKFICSFYILDFVDTPFAFRYEKHLRISPRKKKSHFVGGAGETRVHSNGGSTYCLFFTFLYIFKLDHLLNMA